MQTHTHTYAYLFSTNLIHVDFPQSLMLAFFFFIISMLFSFWFVRGIFLFPWIMLNMRRTSNRFAAQNTLAQTRDCNDQRVFAPIHYRRIRRTTHCTQETTGNNKQPKQQQKKKSGRAVHNQSSFNYHLLTQKRRKRTHSKNMFKNSLSICLI